VKDSLEKFLAESKDEDMLFLKDSIVEGKNGSVQRNDYSIDPDGETSSKKSRSTSERSRRRKKKEGKQQRGDEDLDASLSKVFESALSKIFDDDDMVKESERSPRPDLKRTKTSKRRGSSRSGTSRQQPTRTQTQSSDKSYTRSTRSRARTQSPNKSYTSSARSRARTQSPNKIYTSSPRSLVRRRSRSEIGGKTGVKNNKTKSETNQLGRCLSSLDRQVRRDRMKQEYRGPQGEESVASNKSYTTRSYNRSGLEGGGLNALVARRGIRGGDAVSRPGNASASSSSASFADASFASESAGEEFLKERKAQQELILDVAMREKLLRETKIREEEQRHKKKMKKVKRKTAKISKSGAKVAANAVMDSKGTARKADSVANQVEKETAKMVNSPSLIAKRCAKGIKETANITAIIAKGGFEATSALAKKRIKIPSMKNIRNKNNLGSETQFTPLELSDAVHSKSDAVWWDI
jgi:hypothetical protein